MRLFRLIEALSKGGASVVGVKASPSGPSDPDIYSIHYDSRTVSDGGLFVALPGSRNDGHDFVAQAVEKGAAAVVAEREITTNVPVVRVEDSRHALALLAKTFYGDPSSRLTMVGITGTNGKTTTAALIESILARAGYNVGVIGTGNYRFAGKRFVNPLTTPESLELQQILSEMEDAGVTHVVMEVSSHALAQRRVGGCAFDVRVFTNLTQDHLDFHGDMESYWKCKRLLFDGAYAGNKRGTAVINRNDPRGEELFCDISRSVECIDVGFTDSFTVHPGKVSYGPAGIDATVETPAGAIPFFSPLAGVYNLENILCAVGAALALCVDCQSVKGGIESFDGVPGRLERVANNVGRFVFVDYAHTPDALANVLDALSGVCEGRLICVFGCGGDRDKRKRPLMGEIAAKKAHITIVTSDNPRSEDPQAIIGDIVEGMEGAARRVYDQSKLCGASDEHLYFVEPDRSLGIRAAVSVSLPGDVVLIAGKGEETYQIFKDRTIDFDDRLEAARALSGLEDRRKGRMCAT